MSIVPKKINGRDKIKITLDDLPEITMINQEIERFKRTMLQTPTHEEEESYRALAKRHFLNGLERAKEVLILSHYETLGRRKLP